MATYPGGIWSVPTRNTGDIIAANFFNDPNNEIIAIETDLVNGIQVVLKPLVDLGKDIGTTTKRFANIYSSALFALDVGSRVNYLEVDASATGNPVLVRSKGTDLTVNLNIGTKGGDQLKFVDVASLVNFLQITGRASGASPDLAFTGADATVGGTLSTKGGIQLKFIDVASIVNFLQIAGTATTVDPVVLSVQGDADRGLQILPKRFGGIWLGKASPATTDTGSFPGMPSMAGLPTGTPSPLPVGFAPFVWDDTNKNFKVYSPGAAAWQNIGGASATHTVQVLTASATYTTPANVKAIRVRILGPGGGAGGGSTASAGGGGGGAYSEKWISSPSATYVVTIGTGGAGGAAGNNNGNNGSGASSFGAAITGVGAGVGGISDGGSGLGGAGGAAGTGGDVNVAGMSGSRYDRGGIGGGTHLFSPTVKGLAGNGGDNAIANTGAGGSGGITAAGGGGNGAAGICIVEEFY